MVTDATPPATPLYVGRFAPSPTGPLHFGSLLAAAGSYLRARQAKGQWLVRVEDIDPPREVEGAADEILRALDAYGFEWDGEVLYQSTRIDAYRESLAALDPQTFACDCSRKTIAEASRRTSLPAGRYPGTCRTRGLAMAAGRAVRIRCDSPPAFSDLLQGHFEAQTAPDDFVLWRRDGLPAYQLAVSVDDAAQGITEVVRGCDLLDTTPRQVFLETCLGLPAPAFLHLPVIAAADGQKLSKQTGARALDLANPQATLCAAFKALGLAPPPALKYEGVPDLWRWATQSWSPKPLKGIRTLPIPKE